MLSTPMACAVRDMDTKQKIFEIIKKYLTKFSVPVLFYNIFFFFFVDMATIKVDTEVNMCAVFCTDNFFCVRDVTFCTSRSRV